MASVRKTKKLLKMRKQTVEITVKDWDVAYNKAVITMDIHFKFVQFGVTLVCLDHPFTFIPYWQIGHINIVKS